MVTLQQIKDYMNEHMDEVRANVHKEDMEFIRGRLGEDHLMKETPNPCESGVKTNQEFAQNAKGEGSV